MPAQQLELFGEVVGVARDQDQAHKVLREYAEEADISRSTLDDLSCLPDGYSAKLLSDPPRKLFSMSSFFGIVDALGLAIAFVKDKRRQARISKAPRRCNVSNIQGHWRNTKALSMACDLVKKSAVVNGSNGGKTRWTNSTPQERSKHARMMALTRWKARDRRRKEVLKLLNQQ